MRYLSLGTIVALAFACAGNQNKEDEAEGMRIRDTSLSSRDTLNPSDTLDRARRVVDSTAVMDTSLAR